MRLRTRASMAFIASLLLAAPAAVAQERPAAPVRFTEAREYPVQKTLELPGSVESRTAAVVASEVAGLVMDLPVREGDTVLKGQPLAQLKTADLDLRLRATQSQIKEAESRLKLAELNLDRARELFAQKVTSQQQLDESFYEFNAWQGRAEQYAAEAARLRLDIERSSIRAPFAGVIVAKRTELGQWIAVGGPVFEVVSLDELEVRVDVPERYFVNLNPGAEAKVTFESIEGVELAGRVTVIIPRADPQARTFPIKVRIPNKEGRIGVGMLAQVSIPAGESYRATVVPKDAVVSQGRDKVVYLINSDDTVTPVPVQTGAGVGSWIAVSGEVRAGHKVITRGNERIFPGMTVQGQPQEYALP